MRIYELTCLTEAVNEAFKILIPQLAPDIQVPDKKHLEEIVNSGHTKVFVAEDDKIRGTLTLVFQKTPTGDKAWIEDVVVDASARGRGIGEKLIRHAIDYTVQKGVNKIDLTSVPERTVANKLYQKMGFIKRETNIYRLTLKQTNERK